MTNQVRLLKIAVVLTVVVSLAIVILVPSSSVVGTTLKLGPETLPLPAADLSALPSAAIEDAAGVAGGLYDGHPEVRDRFTDQLLATYQAAEDKDFVIFFNPGGWGWNVLEASPQWSSIIAGIETELAGLGYASLLLNYQRTAANLQGYFGEAMSMTGFYPTQAKDLAGRVDFMTSYLPGLTVIIAGESNGSVVADDTMKLLKDNPQVYSIQTGPPFWHKSAESERALVLQSNGDIPDYFSYGDILTLIRANLEALFGLSQGEAGQIMLSVAAPGHEYWWDSPGVCSRITGFLEHNFGAGAV